MRHYLYVLTIDAVLSLTCGYKCMFFLHFLYFQSFPHYDYNVQRSFSEGAFKMDKDIVSAIVSDIALNLSRTSIEQQTVVTTTSGSVRFESFSGSALDSGSLL